MNTENQKIDDLEAREFTPLGQQPGAADAPGTEASAEDQSQAQAMAVIEAGAAKVLFALLKMARAFIAKQLPEIRDEWTDPVLKGPADAAVPVLKKYLDRIMQLAGSNPELAVFAMSLVPLGMGYMAALDNAGRAPAPSPTAEDVTVK